MKKVITIISCCIIIFSIGGCMNREKYMSDWFTSEQEEADKMMEQIIEACRKQDTQKLKELFSENSRKNIKNIDVKINELFQYLKGDIQTFEGDCASSSDSDHGKKIIELDGMYNISTSSEKYHMNFYMYSQNDSDSKAVTFFHIQYRYIIKKITITVTFPYKQSKIISMRIPPSTLSDTLSFHLIFPLLVTPKAFVNIL